MYRHTLLRFCCAAVLCASSYAQTAAQSSESVSEEQAIRAVIEKFAAARNAHDGIAIAAFYAEDGQELRVSGHSVSGRDTLAKLWSKVTDHADRTIRRIELAAPNLAVATVGVSIRETGSHLNEVLVFVKLNGAWRIQLHEARPE
jgi:uncharacterized protein (TIGR02246 family)